MRDSCDPAGKGFAAWRATGGTGAYEWGDHLDVVRAPVARGVTIRRVRVISEPLSEYLRWEHACTGVNIEAGEDVRWLPRTKAAGLLLPGADCWVSGHRVVRWNEQPLARSEGARASAWHNPPDALTLLFLSSEGILIGERKQEGGPLVRRRPRSRLRSRAGWPCSAGASVTVMGCRH